MPDTASITIVKRFVYRGVNEEWSNKYHFEGPTPSTTAAWKTLADAIIQVEKPIVVPAVKFVRAYGYEAGNENSVAQIDYSIPPATILSGTLSVTATGVTSGDQAATIRWYTGAVSSRGKKIYCRKYFHGVERDGADMDKVSAAWIALANVYGGKMIDGTLPSGVKYSGPQGADLSDPRADMWLTTRTLKRRGRRPPS